MKYTPEQIVIMTEEYEENPSKETVDDLASRFNTSPRSIVGKLSRLGVYKKAPYTPKYAEKPISKEELVHKIAEHLEVDFEDLLGLSKAQKPALLRLVEILET